MFLLTCLSWRTTAVETSDSIDTRGTVKASSSRAVVDVNRAVRAGPAVNANTRKTADAVRASGAILTYRWSGGAFVYVSFTIWA